MYDLVLRESFLGYLVVRVRGNTINVESSFRSDHLLLLLYPAVHIRVGELGPPPSQGLRRPLRRPGAPRAVRTVGLTACLKHSCGCFPWSPVPMFCLTLSQQCASAEARFKGRLS